MRCPTNEKLEKFLKEHENETADLRVRQEMALRGIEVDKFNELAADYKKRMKAEGDGNIGKAFCFVVNGRLVTSL